MRHFYGFEHAYGKYTGDADGNDLGRCHAFASPAERDAWVARRRTEYLDQAGYREAYPAAKARQYEITEEYPEMEVFDDE